MKLSLEEIRDILLDLIHENKLLILPVSKDPDKTDYPEPVTPSGIGTNDAKTHILIVVHPENQEPDFILSEKQKEEKKKLN